MTEFKDKLLGSEILARMAEAPVRVRNRLVATSRAIRFENIPYAITGDCAVSLWVATVDRAAVRNTQDVDLLIRRSDFDRVRSSMEQAGFTYRKAAGLELFLDHGATSPRDAVHLVFANELVRAGEAAPNPGVEESTDLGDFRVINLDALVRIKLTAFRDKDRTHLRDLIGVGLIDGTWVQKLQGQLAERLQTLLDTPDG
ncbi:MAG: hypothetical protein JNK16_03850 [Phycisphaerales bacterium]|nr:hypothetical protein [Phycisphaerales bacterium]